MRTAAITGATGFIGKHLVAALLERGIKVRVLTRDVRKAREMLPGTEVHACDLSQDHAVPRSFVEDVDVLYHCAGEIRNPAAMQALHVDGTTRLLDAAIGRIGHFVQLSSVGAYGPLHNGKVDESWDCAPVGPYEVTKTLADALVEEAVRHRQLCATLLRPSIVFGRDMPNRSLAQWVDAIARRRFFFIGPPGALVNYVHVSGVVEALLLCGNVQKNGLSTYIASESMTVENFVAVVAEALGLASPRIRIPVPLARWMARTGSLAMRGFPLTSSRIDALTSRTEYSADRLRTELGWRSPMPLPLALHDFVKNVRAGA